jgi:dihydrofolate synthase/folylpolyglutamate synthase
MGGHGVMTLGDALAWLDRHQNLERMLASSTTPRPDPARMRRFMDVLGNPETAAPAIHVTGTNGKTSTSRAVTALLTTKGLSVGTYTSPHLERINERLSLNGTPISDGELAQVLSDLAGLEPLVSGPSDQPLSWFELLTAAALRWFADRAVDVMVIEVGIGGRWDATNVVDAGVAVVTNVGLDHTEFLGPTRADVAGEKAGIAKPGATLVLGEQDPLLYPIFASEGPEVLWWAGRDYAVTRNDLAVGGRALDLRTPGAEYEGVWLDLHGRHQADNFAAGLVAVEAFFGAPVEDGLVREAAGSLRSPGRLEIVSRRPLVVLDGAKNLEGARAAATAIASDFGLPPFDSGVAPFDSGVAPFGAGPSPGGTVSPPAKPEPGSLIVVFGMLAGKDPTEMLVALGADHARLIVACPPPSPRAVPASVIVEAARGLHLPGLDVWEAESVPEAVELALGAAGPDDLVLVAGSLYVVGAARAVFAGHLPSTSTR